MPSASSRAMAGTPTSTGRRMTREATARQTDDSDVSRGPVAAAARRRRISPIIPLTLSALTRGPRSMSTAGRATAAVRSAKIVTAIPA